MARFTTAAVHEIAAFSESRALHQNPVLTDRDWCALNARASMRDWGNPGEWRNDADYCLDRYSRIEHVGMPGYRARGG